MVAWHHLDRRGDSTLVDRGAFAKREAVSYIRASAWHHLPIETLQRISGPEIGSINS
jgi:hypothetical protein